MSSTSCSTPHAMLNLAWPRTKTITHLFFLLLKIAKNENINTKKITQIATRALQLVFVESTEQMRLDSTYAPKKLKLAMSLLQSL